LSGKTGLKKQSTRQIGEIERQNWPEKTVREITRQCAPENTVKPDENVVKVLGRMNQSGVSRMMVVKDGKLKGIISLKDIMASLSSRMELEGDSSFTN